jgi:hypothetical protein
LLAAPLALSFRVRRTGLHGRDRPVRGWPNCGDIHQRLEGRDGAAETSAQDGAMPSSHRWHSSLGDHPARFGEVGWFGWPISDALEGLMGNDPRFILRPFDKREGMSVSAAAKLAGRSASTMRNWCEVHGIGRRVAGGNWVVSRVALQMLLDGRQRRCSRCLPSLVAPSAEPR